MTLQELLNEFAGLSFVSMVGNINFDTDLVPEKDKMIFPNLELFEVPFIEVQGDTAIKRTEYVYVLNGGTENEIAKWKDRYPMPTTRSNDIKQKFASLIEQYNGKVVDEGSNHVIVEAYVPDGTGSLTKKQYLIDRAGTITEVV